MPSVRRKAKSAPNQPRSPPRPSPALASRRRLLPAPTIARGCRPPCSRRVKIWITPPMASAPYRLECGPRTISIRSINSTGRSCSAGRPAVAEPMRTPSTSTSNWLDPAPRRNSEVCLPRPPMLVRLMPARPDSSCCSEVAWLRSISARPITWAGDRLSRSAISVRVAVTSTSSSSVAGSEAALAANAGRASARATAVVSGRDIIGQLQCVHGAAPGARKGVAWRGRSSGQAHATAATARRDALRIATWDPQGRSPGSRSGGSATVPGSGGDAFPCRAQWRKSQRCGRLPLRGQRRPCPGLDPRRTGFPFQPGRRMPPRSPCRPPIVVGAGLARDLSGQSPGRPVIRSPASRAPR